MLNYINSGDRITVALDSGETVTSGDLVEIDSNLYGVAQADGDGDDGDSVVLLRSGRFNLTITAGTAGSAGAPVYHDAGVSGVTLKAIGPRVGYLADDLGAADTEADVVLTPDAGGSVFVEGVAELDIARAEASEGAGVPSGTDVEFGDELPAGAVIVEAYINVGTTFASATDAATIALGLKTDAEGDLDAAIAISNAGNPWDAGTRVSDAHSGGSPTTKLTAARRFVANFAGGETVTAGRLQVLYRYFVAE